MNENTIDSLNFTVVLDDADFNKRVKSDIEAAKDLNVSVSRLLEMKRKVASVEARAAKGRADTTKEALARQKIALAEERVATQTQKTALAQQKVATETARTAKARAQLNRIETGITYNYTSQSRLLRDLAGLAGAYLSVRGLGLFLSNVARITGEMETQRIALRTMLGDMAKADQVLGDVERMALKSPYTFSDLTKYTKQLAAFGSSSDTVVDELKMAADLAAGVGADMGLIILAWGQIRSATVLRGQELRQLTETGLPIMEELAKVLSDVEGRAVSVGEVFDLVSKRAVSFDMVRKAFVNMTSEGGKFYQMQEALSESIEGRISNLKDAFEAMMRSIGEQNSDRIKNAIDTARRWMEHYQTVGKVLAALVVTFGTYKAALLAVSAAHKVAGFVENIRLIAMMRKEVGLLTATQQAFNVASRSNLYIALASAVLGVVAAVTTFNKRQEEAVRTAGRASQTYEQERREIKRLIDAAGDETRSRDERRRAVDELNNAYGQYLGGLVKETSTARDLAAAYDSVTDALRRKYLEEQRTAMTGGAQEQAGTAQAGFWGFLKKTLSGAGLTPQAMGAAIARLQNAFGLDGSGWGAMDIYKEILAAVTAGGGKLSSRRKGDLYRRAYDLTESRDALAGAERQFRQFADGFNQAVEEAASGADHAADQILTKASTIADGIRATMQRIKSLEAVAKGAGLTDAQVKELQGLRDDLEDMNASFKAITGEDFAKSGAATRKYTSANDDFYKRLERDIRRYTEQIEQAEIDAMEEGDEKTLAAIEHGHQQRTQAIREAYEDELAQLARTDAENGRRFDPAKDPRAQSLLRKYGKAFIAEDLKHENELAAAEKKILDEREANRLAYLERYGSLKEKETAITEKYRQRISAMPAGDTYGIKLLEGQRDEELAAIRREYTELYALVFTDAARLGDNLLARAIEETQRQIHKAANDGDIKALSELYERLRGLMDERTGRSTWGVGGIVRALRDLRAPEVTTGDRVAMENDIERRSSALALLEKSGRELLDVIRSAGEALESWPGVLGQIGSTLAGLAGDADKLMTALVSSNRGEIATAGIGAALNILQMIGAQIADNRQELERWEAAVRNAEQAARLRRIDAAAGGDDSIFGLGSPYKSAIEGVKKYTQAMAELAAMEDALAGGMVQTGTRKAVSWGNVGKGTGAGAAAGAALGSIIPGIGTAIGAAVGAAIGLVTGALTTRTEPVFESLLSHYGNLVDADFNLNQQILDDYDKLDETTRSIVDNWQAIREKAMQSQQEMRDNLSAVVGDMADTIRDKLVEAWRSRDIYKAIDDIGDYAGGVIEDLIEQGVFASIFGNVFKNLQTGMEASFAPGGDQDITDDLAGFLEVYPGLLETFAAAMDQARVTAEQMTGLDLWKPGDGDSSTLAGGISKELIEGNSSLLASYINGIRADTSSMRSMMEPFFSRHLPTLSEHIASMDAHAANIARNTAETVQEIRQFYGAFRGVVTSSTNGGNAIRTTK